VRLSLLAILLIVPLSGCSQHAAGLAGNLALNVLGQPIAKLAVEGGKAMYAAASEAWRENMAP